MSRWLFPWSGSIKKRACRYLLQHYLGHFLQERLSLDQLGLDLYNGSGVIKEINLDVWVSFQGRRRAAAAEGLCYCGTRALLTVSQPHSSLTTISNVTSAAELTFLRGKTLITFSIDHLCFQSLRIDAFHTRRANLTLPLLLCLFHIDHFQNKSLFPLCMSIFNPQRQSTSFWTPLELL